MWTTDTIAALATPAAAGGIAVIRISGADALPIAERVFSKPLSGQQGYTAVYGRMAAQGKTLDDGVALVFRAPHSYTGEDTVELSCHGGVYLANRILRALYAAGARPAAAGEFTRRAYQNGKLTLTQAEAVAQLIAADGEQAVLAARAGLDGALARRLAAEKETLLQILARLSAWADYPDEDLEPVERETLCAELSALAESLGALLRGYDSGRLVREGIAAAIVGKPNVGKSTLMNLLAGCDKSIVTAQPGTTRDVVEETVRLGKAVLHLSDTAGLRETADPVEREGVSRARRRMEEATLVIAVFDRSEPLTAEDVALLESLRGRAAIAVLNKGDLPAAVEEGQLRPYTGYTVTLSAKEGEGLSALIEAVEELSELNRFDPSAALLANARQYHAACRAAEAVGEGLSALRSGFTLDAVTVSLTDALAALLELSGESVTEAVVDEVFSRFCVGK